MKYTKWHLIHVLTFWVLIWTFGFIFGGCGTSPVNPANDPPEVVQLSSGIDHRDPDVLVCEHQRITFNIIQYRLDHGEDAARTAEDALQTAIDGWNDLSGLPLFDLVATYETYSPGQNVDHDIGVGITDLPNGVLGRALPPGNCTCGIFIDPEAAPYWKLYAHELGHCLGFKHSGNVNSDAQYQTYLDSGGTDQIEESIMFWEPKTGNFTQEMIDNIKSSPIHYTKTN